MQSKRWGLVCFGLGVFCIFLYTTVPFLGYLIGVSLPHLPLPGMVWGFITPIGAVLMVIGGLLYGLKQSEVTK